jgi:hypothetical protein
LAAVTPLGADRALRTAARGSDRPLAGVLGLAFAAVAVVAYRPLVRSTRR